MTIVLPSPSLGEVSMLTSLIFHYILKGAYVHRQGEAHDLSDIERK